MRPVFISSMDSRTSPFDVRTRDVVSCRYAYPGALSKRGSVPRLGRAPVNRSPSLNLPGRLTAYRILTAPAYIDEMTVRPKRRQHKPAPDERTKDNDNPILVVPEQRHGSIRASARNSRGIPRFKSPNDKELTVAKPLGTELPTSVLTMNDAPTARPPMKLWSLSASRIR